MRNCGGFGATSVRISIAVLIAAAALVRAVPCSGQDLGRDVDNLNLVSLSAKSTRLTWEPVHPVECENTVTYSVFRGTNEDFTPSLANRVASGLTKTTYVATEPVSGKDYYYQVTAVVSPTTCVPRSGTVVIYPLDLGKDFRVVVGSDAGTCTATSTSQIACQEPLLGFHAAIAAQGGHES